MTTCEDVNNLKLDGMKLIAGENGLHRAVTWSYMVQTKPYKDHMNQGNFAMIVVDYVRFSFEDVERDFPELIELGISGLAISVINDREKIPDSIIKIANDNNMPLFFIRWEGASFVDVAQSIGMLINETTYQNKRTGDYLYNLLFGYEINHKYIEKISGQFGLDFTNPYRVGIIVVDRKYGINLEQDEHTYEYYGDSIYREVMNMKDKPMFMRFLNKFVLLFEAKESKQTEKDLEKILKEIDERPQFKGKIRSTRILGNAYRDPGKYGVSYQEAKSLIPKKDILPNPKRKKVLSISSLGIYKYLFNSGNHKEIIGYCDKKLNKLEEYDHANGTFLEDTLLAYYMNGFVAGKTAEALFIHRNSLQYRLSKIEELIDAPLNDYMEYLDLINCILVKKLIYS